MSDIEKLKNHLENIRETLKNMKDAYNKLFEKNNLIHHEIIKCSKKIDYDKELLTNNMNLLKKISINLDH